MNSIENAILLQDFESAIELIYFEYNKTQDEYLALYFLEIADNEIFNSKNFAFWLILKIDQFEKNCNANNPEIFWILTELKIKLDRLFDNYLQNEIDFLWQFVKRFPNEYDKLYLYLEKCADFEVFSEIYHDHKFISDHYNDKSVLITIYLYLSVIAKKVDINWSNENRMNEITNFYNKANELDPEMTNNVIENSLFLFNYYKN